MKIHYRKKIHTTTYQNKTHITVYATLLVLVLIGILYFCAACGTNTNGDTLPPDNTMISNQPEQDHLKTPNVSAKLSLTPRDVNRDGFSTISCSGSTTMAVDAKGSLWGWGDNTSMQIISDPNIQYVDYPAKIMENIVSVCVQPGYALAIDMNGFLWGWGNVDIGMSKPHKILEQPVISASAYMKNLSAILTDGTVVTGKLDEFSFKEVLKDAISVSTGAIHTLAIKKDGTLWGWGSNKQGQLGENALTIDEHVDYCAPFQILDNVSTVLAADVCSYAIKDNGTVWAWGSVGLDEPTDPETVTMKCPTQIFENAVGLAGGSNNIFIIKDDGTLWGWGFCRLGQLGNRLTAGDCTTDNSYQSTPIKLDDCVLAVTSNGLTTFWMKSDRCLYGCGMNFHSMLGNPDVGNDTGWYIFRDVEIPIQTMPIKIMEDMMLPEDLYNWGGELESAPESVPEYPDIVGDWQDSWSERCHMTVTYEGDNCYKIDTLWSSTATEYDEWVFSGHYEPSTGELCYNNGNWFTYAEDETGYLQEGWVLDNMQGRIYFDDAGILHWEDYSSVEFGYDFGSSNMRFEQIG